MGIVCVPRVAVLLLVVRQAEVAGRGDQKNLPFSREAPDAAERGVGTLVKVRFVKIDDVVADDRAPRVGKGLECPIEGDHVSPAVMKIQGGTGGDVVDDLKHRRPLVAAEGVREDFDVGRDIPGQDGIVEVVHAIRDDADLHTSSVVSSGVPEVLRPEDGIALRVHRTGSKERRQDSPHRPYLRKGRKTFQVLDPHQGHCQMAGLVPRRHLHSKGVDAPSPGRRVQRDIDCDRRRGGISRGEGGIVGDILPRYIHLHQVDEV